ITINNTWSPDWNVALNTDRNEHSSHVACTVKPSEDGLIFSTDVLVFLGLYV
ncbi:hypothetical protein L9F63_028239, partial [Diploptera punctata]